ncbi:hypothetical protein [Hungatella sp.]|uniref:hypothetical protein n=1 Tax=Hungatella sp. TaxID=2613924 RepID=UPI003996430D
MKEQEKYEIIKKLVETSGNKDNAALKLSVSRRQINRMMKGYKEQGKAFFVHGNRGRKPATALSEDIRKRIVSLYQEQYFDANFTHFTQLLAEREGILVSTTTIQSILEEHYILSPMVTKAKQKRISAHLKAVQKTASHKEAVEIQKISLLWKMHIHENHGRLSLANRNRWMLLLMNGSVVLSHISTSL